MSDEVKKETHAEYVKRDAASLIKNDVIGVSDWKRSKFGALTGFSVARRVVGSIGANARGSTQRVTELVGIITAPDALPEIHTEGSPEDRFTETQNFYGLSERQLQSALRNTFYSICLYASITVFYVCFMIWSFWAWPINGPFEAAARFGPLPLITALLFKHSFTNWIIRSRRIGDGPLRFIASFNYMPSKK